MCTSEELIDAIWDGNEFVGRPAIRKIVYKLRVIFNKHQQEGLIETVPKKGYRFNISKRRKRKWIRMRPRTVLLILVGLVVAIVIIKLIDPGIFNRMWHRLGH